MQGLAEKATSKREGLALIISSYKEQHKDYSNFAAFIYVKGLTGYSDDNCILILEQCDQRGMNPFDLVEIKGFYSWLDKGRCIKKGEHCFYILAPIVKRVRDEESGELVSRVVGYKSAFVFDISQTDEMTAEQRGKAKTKEGKQQYREEREERKAYTGNMSEHEARNILGLGAEPLTEDVLKAAFRKAALANHPDHGGNVEAMKQVNNAHDCLKARI
jgi:hypothetical protein